MEAKGTATTTKIYVLKGWLDVFFFVLISLYFLVVVLVSFFSVWNTHTHTHHAVPPEWCMIMANGFAISSLCIAQYYKYNLCVCAVLCLWHVVLLSIDEPISTLHTLGRWLCFFVTGLIATTNDDNDAIPYQTISYRFSVPRQCWTWTKLKKKKGKNERMKREMVWASHRE